MAVSPRDRSVEICPMRLCDLDDVAAIERVSFAAPWSRQVFVDELERDWAHLDVVKERGPAGARAVAFCNYWLVHDEVHILNLATHANARRQGHASRLLAHVIEFARRHSCRYITLEVRRSNQVAHDLYIRHGFRPVGIRPRYYVNNQEDAIVMLLDFVPSTETPEP